MGSNKISFVARRQSEKEEKMSGIGYFKPATVDRLRRLTGYHFGGAQAFKREVIETSGERVRRRHVTQQTLYDENVEWDYGWARQLTFLATRGEVVAFNLVLMNMDSHPKDMIYEICEETDDLHLLHDLRKEDVVWVCSYLVPVLKNKKVIPTEEELFLDMVRGRYPNPKYIALFPHAKVEDVIVNADTKKEWIKEF